jgi:hypothetical protein
MRRAAAKAEDQTKLALWRAAIGLIEEADDTI